ncbi:MAG: TIGR02281 family clan AA aspartic protease [Terriglobus roseus]|nr:TIGR02281 family clan AA aspartic protease [Terriglobus roseus]
MLSLALWGAVLFAVLAGYSYRFELGTVAERVMAVLVPGTVVESGPREVTVFRRPDGGFTLDATVGRTRVPFTFDTGASSVVLRSEDAARLKIPVRTLDYDVEVMTANGLGLAAEVTLPSLTIGPLTQTDVKALVEKPGALHENSRDVRRLKRAGNREEKLLARKASYSKATEGHGQNFRHP